VVPNGECFYYQNKQCAEQVASSLSIQQQCSSLHKEQSGGGTERKREREKGGNTSGVLTLSNPIFLPPAYSPALIYFGWERCWWIICNYPTVLKEKNSNRNRKSITCTICWLKSGK
jgi:hypothetical protein